MNAKITRDGAVTPTILREFWSMYWRLDLHYLVLLVYIYVNVWLELDNWTLAVG
jgi:hypothetical protein